MTREWRGPRKTPQSSALGWMYKIKERINKNSKIWTPGDGKEW